MSRSHRRTALALALVVATVHEADAQSPSRRAQSSADTVRLAADLFFRAVADERWTTAATMVDTTLVRFVVAQRLRWQQQFRQPELTVEDFMRDDPAKPRIVAEYEFKRYRERTAPIDGDFISAEFAGVRSLRELARLTSLEATARYLEAQDSRVQIREAARRAGCPDSTSRPPVSLRHIVGVALTSDTVAYVLHDDGSPRDESDGLPRLEPMVMQMRLRGSAWTIIPGSALLRSPALPVVPTQCGTPRRPSP
jgi:hypothetical protein